MKLQWFIYPFCSIFMVAGIGIAFTQIGDILKSRAINDWPTVNARLTKCDFKDLSNPEANSYEVSVQYEYTVQGKDYSSTTIHPTYSASNNEGHKHLYEALRKCSIVRARYNAPHPEESYLVTGTFTSSLSTLFSGMLLFSVGFFLLLMCHFAIKGNWNYASGLDIIQ